MLNDVAFIYDLLDDPSVNGSDIRKVFERYDVDVHVKIIKGEKGKTDVITIRIPGKGKENVLGIIGQLGGVGARPNFIGLVSDGDGAVVALASALKLAKMRQRGDILESDVIVATHVCPNAPIEPHEPVPFMGSPVGVKEVLRGMITSDMKAILSIDTTRGNRIINVKGFAISPTVKEGYILKPSDDLLDIYERVCGKLPVVLPITMQDVTPYGNGIHHINSIMQPATITKSPVVGIAITSEVPVPGCATGTSSPTDLEPAVRFCVEVAKSFTSGECRFYDHDEFERLVKLYGSMLKLVGMEE